MVSPPVVTVKLIELVPVPAGRRDGDASRRGADGNGGLDVPGSDDRERGGRRAVESHGRYAREVRAVDVDGGADRARVREEAVDDGVPPST